MTTTIKFQALRGLRVSVEVGDGLVGRVVKVRVDQATWRLTSDDARRLADALNTIAAACDDEEVI